MAVDPHSVAARLHIFCTLPSNGISGLNTHKCGKLPRSGLRKKRICADIPSREATDLEAWRDFGTTRRDAILALVGALAGLWAFTCSARAANTLVPTGIAAVDLEAAPALFRRKCCRICPDSPRLPGVEHGAVEWESREGSKKEANPILFGSLLTLYLCPLLSSKVRQKSHPSQSFRAS